MNETKYKLLNYILLGIGFFTSLGFMVYAAGGLDGLFNIFSLWVALPFFVLLYINHLTTSLKALITIFTLGILCALSTYFYFESLSIADAQGALIFLFLPLYQILAIVVVFLILTIVKYISGRK